MSCHNTHDHQDCGFICGEDYETFVEMALLEAPLSDEQGKYQQEISHSLHNGPLPPPAATGQIPPYHIPVHHLNPGTSSIEAGSSCHQCKSRRAYFELIYCTQLQRKKKGATPTAPMGCRKKYCEHCLFKFYHEQRPSETALKTWTCPSCRHECSCAACRKKGEETTTWGNESRPENRHTRNSSYQELVQLDIYGTGSNKRTTRQTHQTREAATVPTVTQAEARAERREKIDRRAAAAAAAEAATTTAPPVVTAQLPQIPELPQPTHELLPVQPKSLAMPQHTIGHLVANKYEPPQQAIVPNLHDIASPKIPNTGPSQTILPFQLSNPHNIGQSPPINSTQSQLTSNMDRLKITIQSTANSPHMSSVQPFNKALNPLLATKSPTLTAANVGGMVSPNAPNVGQLQLNNTNKLQSMMYRASSPSFAPYNGLKPPPGPVLTNPVTNATTGATTSTGANDKRDSSLFAPVPNILLNTLLKGKNFQFPSSVDAANTPNIPGQPMLPQQPPSNLTSSFPNTNNPLNAHVVINTNNKGSHGHNDPYHGHGQSGSHHTHPGSRTSDQQPDFGSPLTHSHKALADDHGSSSYVPSLNLQNLQDAITSLTRAAPNSGLITSVNGTHLTDAFMLNILGNAVQNQSNSHNSNTSNNHNPNLVQNGLHNQYKLFATSHAISAKDTSPSNDNQPTTKIMDFLQSLDKNVLLHRNNQNIHLNDQLHQHTHHPHSSTTSSGNPNQSTPSSSAPMNNGLSLDAQTQLIRSVMGINTTQPPPTDEGYLSLIAQLVQVGANGQANNNTSSQLLELRHSKEKLLKQERTDLEAELAEYTNLRSTYATIALKDDPTTTDETKTKPPNFLAQQQTMFNQMINMSITSIEARIKRITSEIEQLIIQQQAESSSQKDTLALFTTLWVLAHTPNIRSQLDNITSRHGASVLNKTLSVYELFQQQLIAMQGNCFFGSPPALSAQPVTSTPSPSSPQTSATHPISKTTNINATIGSNTSSTATITHSASSIGDTMSDSEQDHSERQFQPISTAVPPAAQNTPSSQSSPPLQVSSIQTLLPPLPTLPTQLSNSLPPSLPSTTSSGPPPTLPPVGESNLPSITNQEGSAMKRKQMSGGDDGSHSDLTRAVPTPPGHALGQ